MLSAKEAREKSLSERPEVLMGLMNILSREIETQSNFGKTSFSIKLTEIQRLPMVLNKAMKQLTDHGYTVKWDETVLTIEW